MGTAKNEFFRLPRKPANAHFIRVFGDAEKFFCTYLTQSEYYVEQGVKTGKKLRKKSGMLRDSFGNQQAELLLFLMDMEFAMTIGQRL